MVSGGCARPALAGCISAGRGRVEGARRVWSFASERVLGLSLHVQHVLICLWGSPAGERWCVLCLHVVLLEGLPSVQGSARHGLDHNSTAVESRSNEHMVVSHSRNQRHPQDDPRLEHID